MKMIYDVVLEGIYDTYFSLRAFLLLENYYKLIIRNYLKSNVLKKIHWNFDF